MFANSQLFDMNPNPVNLSIENDNQNNTGLTSTSNTLVGTGQSRNSLDIHSHSSNNHNDNGTLSNPEPAALIRLITKRSHDCFSVMILTKDCVVGRDILCDFQITSIEISRQHAMIEYQQNKWWIINMNSTNGVFVNGSKITHRYPLIDGCLISFGPLSQTSFKYIFVAKYEEYLGLQRLLHQTFTNGLPLSVRQQEFVSSSQEIGTQSLQTNPMDLSLIETDISSDKLNVKIQKFNAERERYRVELAKLKKRMERFHQVIKKNNDMKKWLNLRELGLDKKEKNLNRLMEKFRVLNSKVASDIGEFGLTTTDNGNLNGDNLKGAFASTTTDQQLGTVFSNVLNEVTCPICCEYLIEPTSLSCQHTFCFTCIEHWKRESRSRYSISSSGRCSRNGGFCPVCRKKIESQAQSLIFEQIITMFVEQNLSLEELEERKKLIATRKAENEKLKNLAHNSYSSRCFFQNFMNLLHSPNDGRSLAGRIGVNVGGNAVVGDNADDEALDTIFSDSEVDEGDEVSEIVVNNVTRSGNSLNNGLRQRQEISIDFFQPSTLPTFDDHSVGNGSVPSVSNYSITANIDDEVVDLSVISNASTNNSSQSNDGDVDEEIIYSDDDDDDDDSSFDGESDYQISLNLRLDDDEVDGEENDGHDSIGDVSDILLELNGVDEVIDVEDDDDDEDEEDDQDHLSLIGQILLEYGNTEDGTISASSGRRSGATNQLSQRRLNRRTLSSLPYGSGFGLSLSQLRRFQEISGIPTTTTSTTTITPVQSSSGRRRRRNSEISVAH